IGLAVVAVYGGWALLQSMRGLDGWVNPVAGTHDRPVQGLPVAELLSTSLTGFPLQSGYFLQPSLDAQAVTLWSRALTPAIIAAPFLALAAFAGRSPGWLVGAATLGGLLGYPLVAELQVYLTTHRYFENVTPRYGMSLVPWALACLVLVGWRRGAWRLAGTGTAIGAAAMTMTVAGLG